MVWGRQAKEIKSILVLLFCIFFGFDPLIFKNYIFGSVLSKITVFKMGDQNPKKIK